MSDFELTIEEKKFIKKLKNALKEIPPRLWLFASESGLDVLHVNSDFERVFTVGNAIDQSYIIDSVSDDVQSGSW